MLTAEDVAKFRSIKDFESDHVLNAAVSAVNFYVDSLPNIDRIHDGSTWAPTTHYAALILASRYYIRQHSVSGMTAFGEGETAFVTKYDADVARLLHIDGFEKPVFF